VNSLKDNTKKHPIILHLIDTTGPGGAETVFIQLSDKIRNFGFNSIVVIHGKGWVYNSLIARGIEPIIIPAKGSFNFSLIIKLVRLIKKYRVNIIQSHLLGSNVYAALVGILTRTPVVATYHGMVDVSDKERFKKLKFLVMKHGISRYVAVSEQLKQSINQQGLLESEKTRVIYNGVEFEKYNSESFNLIRRDLGFKDDDVLIGSLGNIRPAKAYDVLISAAAILVSKFKNIRFLIAGHPKEPLIQQLQSMITQFDLSDNVFFLGFQEDSVTFLKQMDFFILCSQSEGFSIATIEAMAAGLPIVVTRCGGPEEIVKHHHDALMVEVNQPEAIADAIEKLLLDKNLSQKLSNNALRSVKEKFSLEVMLHAYCEEYKNLIG
jgi:glycosyltransferase involved in cell wall biosynthesis